MFRKILIANRGEIAVRIIRACRDLGISPVAVYSEADRAALHVRMADEAYLLGPAPSSESYLVIDKVLEAAARSGAEAIHPGYGFLSENARFAQACADAGVPMIGPPASAIRLMGDKTRARAALRERGVPLVPGIERPLASLDEAKKIASRVGYPVMLKASAGGGGKGMRLVAAESKLAAALETAASEAERAFGDGSVYLEKFIEQPRHVEIQVVADGHGSAIHLGERECSLQRRHQKVVEECPSPIADADLRRQMGEAALEVVRAAGYVNAGTVEFLVDRDRNFYFLEMNTRLQVEHPVTEMVTGIDLVREQLRIAAGEPLSMRQEDVRWRGWALECRIYAEDPERDFFPSPGRIERLEEPAGPGIRLDSGVYEGWEVPVHYDPLIAKLVSHGADREQAIARMRRALGEYRIAGIRTTIGFFDEILSDREFRRGNLSTSFIGEFMARRRSASPQKDAAAKAAALTAALAYREREAAEPRERAAVGSSAWKTSFRPGSEGMRRRR